MFRSRGQPVHFRTICAGYTLFRNLPFLFFFLLLLVLWAHCTRFLFVGEQPFGTYCFRETQAVIRRTTSLFLGLPKRKRPGWRGMSLPSCLELKFQAVLHFHLIIPYSPKFPNGYLEERLVRENNGGGLASWEYCSLYRRVLIFLPCLFSLF